MGFGVGFADEVAEGGGIVASDGQIERAVFSIPQVCHPPELCTNLDHGALGNCVRATAQSRENAVAPLMKRRRRVPLMSRYFVLSVATLVRFGTGTVRVARCSPEALPTSC